MLKQKIKKGDKVTIITGKDKGRDGEVIKFLPKESKLVVSGLNLSKRHTKATKESEGGIISKEMPLHLSNVAILDPKLGKPTKVGFKVLENGTKVRYAKLSGEILDDQGKK